MILVADEEISARKASKAFWIFVKRAAMNNRNECVSVSSDLLGFVSLRELQYEQSAMPRSVLL